MSEVNDPDPDDEHDDDEPTIPDLTALSAAVRAAVTDVMSQPGNPAAQLLNDNISRIATEALQGHPGIADAIGVGSALQDTLRHLQTPLDGGITSIARSAREAASGGVASWLSPQITGGHRGINSLIAATMPDYVSPFDHLHQRQLDVGVGSSVRAAIDRLSTFESVVGDRLQRYDFGIKQLPGVQSAMDALTRHDSTFAKALQHYDYGINHLHGAQSAMNALTTHQSTFDTVMQHYDIGLGKLTGAQAALDALTADWQTSAAGRFATDYLHGSRGPLTDPLGMQGYGSSLDKLMRDSQHSVQEFMRQQSLMPDPAAWMRDLYSPATLIVEMMRSWWPAADRGFHAARVALRAALKVVRLLTTNDPRAREAVQQFLIDWLGFKYSSHDLVASATLVLLNVQSWLPTGAVPLDFDPCPKLRKLTLAEHRAVNRLSIDPELRFRKRPLLSLEQPVKVTDSDTTPTSLRELLPDRAAPDPSAAAEPEFSDPRIVRVWWRLTPREQEILRVKAQPGVTWAAAAVECGGTPAEGDRLRRKVNRLAKKDNDPQPPIAEAS